MCRWAGLERLQQFLEAVTLDGHTVKTNVYRVTDASDVYRTLRQIDLRSRDGKTFIIDMSTRDTELLLRKIVSLSALRVDALHFALILAEYLICRLLLKCSF